MRAPEETLGWLRGYYDAMDNLRFDDVETFLHEDIETRYPTGDVLQGRARLTKVSERSLRALEGIRHEIRNAWVEDDELIFELDVTYWRRDGQVIKRSGIGIFVLRDRKVASQRLFVDLSGIWD